MKLLVNCGVSAIGFAIRRGATFRWKESRRTLRTLFFQRDAEIDKALAKLLAEKNRNSLREHRGIRGKAGHGEANAETERRESGRTRTLWEDQLTEMERASLRGLSHSPGRRYEGGEARHHG